MPRFAAGFVIMLQLYVLVSVVTLMPLSGINYSESSVVS